ncbi:MAG: hypothetical protein WCF36_11830 [Candidatus Nanopelagicales bacterium]
MGVQDAAEWAGPANDVVGAVASAGMVPMALGMSACLGRPRSLVVATWAAVGAMVINVAASVLLLRDIIPFTAQAAAVPAVAIIFGWLLLVGRVGRAPRRLTAELSTAVVTIGPGCSAPSLSSAQQPCSPAHQGARCSSASGSDRPLPPGFEDVSPGRRRFRTWSWTAS